MFGFRRFQRPFRTARRKQPRFAALRLECLEERTVLDGGGLGSLLDMSSLTVDPQKYDSAGILVRFRDDTAIPSGAEILKGSRIDSDLPLVSGLHQVKLAAGVSVEDALAAYSADPAVLYAEPDYSVQVMLVPNDEQFASQWDMNNTGQTGGIVDADIDAAEAWDVTTGNPADPTIVAVIDTGVDFNHPDLAANIWTNPGEIPGNGVDDDNNGYVDDVHGYDFVNNVGDPMDDNGHGTHVAGTVGAVGNNSIGVAGVNWNVRIMPVKFLDFTGSGSTADAIKALNYAVANGATVSNNSWGGAGYSQALYDAIQNAAGAGHVFVAAAGNDGNDNDLAPFYPASYDLGNVLSVAAVDDHNDLAGFSNYGDATVDIAAPGVDILSTASSSGELSDPSGYTTLSGTSMATPHVAGVVSLVRDQHPQWSYSQVISQVLATAEPTASLLGKTATAGVVNAAAAVGAAAPDAFGPYVYATSPAGTVSGSIASARVTFSEPINGDTFSAVDITSFSGPGGPIGVSDVSEVVGSLGMQYDILFSEQTEFGDYSMTLGPDIEDAAGNLLDVDQDGVGGEAVDDEFHIDFSITDQLVFHSDDVPAPILDWTALLSELTIDQDVTIEDIDVQLDIAHTWDGDLQMYLVAPGDSILAGQYVILSAFNGGSGHDYDNTVFDDEAPLSITQGSAPFAGTYRPEKSLSYFDGRSAKGTWLLGVEDWAFGDEGTLLSWSLRIQAPGAPPPPPPPENLPPDAVGDSASTPEDTAVNVAVLANDTDPENDPLTVTGVSNLQHGVAVVNGDNTVTFTPEQNYNGAAGFTYTISDGQGNSDSASVAIDVTPVNDAPVAAADSYSIDEGTPLNVAAPGVLANDSDTDGDPLTAVLAAGPSHGQLTLNADGSFDYTPNAGFSGGDAFSYTANDGTLDSNTVAVSITVNAVNNAPVAVADSYSTAEDTPLNVAAAGVLANDSDADGDPLTALLAAGPSHGQLTLNADGSFDYTPDADFSGVDAFSYTANDGSLDSNTVAVSITVNAVNDAPVANDDSAKTKFNKSVTIDVLANDVDADGDPLSVASYTQPASGEVVLNADGTLTYTPDGSFVGTVTFNYAATDGIATSADAVVTIDVTGKGGGKGGGGNPGHGKGNGSKSLAAEGSSRQLLVFDVLATTDGDEPAPDSGIQQSQPLPGPGPNALFAQLRWSNLQSDSRDVFFSASPVAAAGISQGMSNAANRVVARRIALETDDALFDPREVWLERSLADEAESALVAAGVADAWTDDSAFDAALTSLLEEGPQAPGEG